MTRAAYWSELDDRLADGVAKALRRKPSSEARLAASVRAAAPCSKKLLHVLAETAGVLVEREAFSRPLYAAAIRTLAEKNHPKAAAILTAAMQSAEGGGLHTMAAATQCSAPSLLEPLARVAASPKAHMAFAATLALRMRGEARAGQLLASVARIKESARIDICTELLSPMLLNGTPASRCTLPASAAGPMRVLRDAERHLGRWLVFARGGLAAGDRSAVDEAERRAREGSQSSRVAWALLAWAVEDGASVPDLRPSAEVIARLSDRPTSEKDMSFLFRLASVRAPGARSMLEALCKGASSAGPPSSSPSSPSAPSSRRGASSRRAPSIDAPVSMRAAATLAALYDDPRGLERLRMIADGDGPRDRAGLAVASLWDAGQRSEAAQRARELSRARNLPCAVWGGLVVDGASVAADRPIVDETSFRRLEAAMVQ